MGKGAGQNLEKEALIARCGAILLEWGLENEGGSWFVLCHRPGRWG